MPNEEANEQLHKYSDEQLGQASRSKVKQNTGCMTLLEAWVYKHMHGVVVPDRDFDYSEVQPHALHWTPRRDNGTTLVNVHKYRHRLDTLNAD
ncbi:unnamed protein product [Prunus armeniaca]|uniref:Aminotransferase-like plant mobile domain-containing protein n=1 Tax=Prunus armeniaca TaxID=36596 RepID=A0A6J5VCN8_PRUAR|nr:unnamed protein product [Prunus armeniaca]CAB4313931.1 unnamed protein product [Prunus armeniaca]